MRVRVEWTAEGGAKGIGLIPPAVSDRRELHPLSAKRICWYAKASGRIFGITGGTADNQVCPMENHGADFFIARNRRTSFIRRVPT